MFIGGQSIVSHCLAFQHSLMILVLTFWKINFLLLSALFQTSPLCSSNNTVQVLVEDLSRLKYVKQVSEAIEHWTLLLQPHLLSSLVLMCAWFPLMTTWDHLRSIHHERYIWVSSEVWLERRRTLTACESHKKQRRWVRTDNCWEDTVLLSL